MGFYCSQIDMRVWVLSLTDFTDFTDFSAGLCVLLLTDFTDFLRVCGFYRSQISRIYFAAVIGRRFICEICEICVRCVALTDFFAGVWDLSHVYYSVY